ncbi:MAG TPA: hypothetical protein VM939_15125 [Gemmatimonadaceae bacterium]|nr:hypothetical protein [Gemmatimonadaceae bacterium]
MTENQTPLRALCVGRHPFLCDHFARFFAGLGLETHAAPGLNAALLAARENPPDLVICEYELLTMLPVEAWEKDELLSRTPLIAVSLTRRSHEAHLLDISGIAGFLYLPTLDRAVAARILTAAASASRHRYDPAAPTTSADAEWATLAS